MKFVKTERSYERLDVDVSGGDGDPKVLHVGPEPLEVSNEHAKQLQEEAAAVGVRLIVADSEDDDALETSPEAFGQPQPDLSAGRSAISGTGPAVLTTDAQDTTTDDDADGVDENQES